MRINRERVVHVGMAAGLLLLLAGCNPSGSGAGMNPGNIWVDVTLAPDTGNLTESRYHAQASIVPVVPEGDFSDDGYFNDAVIQVNSFVLEQNTSYDGQFYCSDTSFVLNSHDAVTVSISHPDLPEIDGTTTVPVPTTGLKITSGDPATVITGTSGSVTLEWDAVPCSAYRVAAYAYDNVGSMCGGVECVMYSNTCAVDYSWFSGYVQGNPVFYEFSVNPINMIDLPQFYGASWIEVKSPARVGITNFPG